MEKHEFIRLLDIYLSGGASVEQEQMIINYYHSFDQSEWDSQLMGDLDQREKAVYMKVKEAIHHLNNPKTRMQRIHLLKTPWFRYAAAVLIIGFFIYLLKPGNRGQQNQQSNIAEPSNEIVTRAGSKTTVSLPDGSTAILNAGSRLSYNKEFGIKSREIILSGEAYFDIQKNEKIPLTVHAGNIDIKVKGTIFNVKAYPEDSAVEAALIMGVIEVSSKKDPGRSILLRPSEKIVIGRNSTIASIETKGFVIHKKDEAIVLTKLVPDPIDSSYAETLWLKDRMVFRSEPFGVLSKRMERWYNVEIRFKDAGLTSLPFTGSFEKESLTEALEALRSSIQFNYEIENRVVTISKNSK